MAGLALESIYIDVLLNGKKAQLGLSQLNKKLKGLNKPVKSLNGIFNKMFKIAGISGFAKMAFDAQKLGRQLGLIADKTGIAASRLAQMRSAFSATGGDAKAIESVLTNITSGLARLSMGNGEMASRLSAMGINAWENGNVKSADVILGDIADWTQTQLKMGRTMQEVSQFLEDNFGIQQDLANQLALGRSGFNAYQSAMASKVGSLNSGEIANLQSLNASFSRLKETVVVLTEKITAGLAPILEFFIDLAQNSFRSLQNVFDYLVNTFSDIVGTGEEVCILFEFLKSGGLALELILKGLIDVVKGVADVLKEMGATVGEFIAWLMAKLGLGGNTNGDINEYIVGKEKWDKELAAGRISKDAYNVIMERLGYYEREDGGWRDITTGTSILELPPALDLEKASSTSNSSQIIIEVDTTTNLNGDITSPEEIKQIMEDYSDYLAGKVQHATTGAY